MQLLSHLALIADPRRKQGQRYQLAPVLLFTVLAILSNAGSYRMIEAYIASHLELLKKKFQLSWKRAPDYSQIRNILNALSIEEIEKAFRMYSNEIKNEKKLYSEGKAIRYYIGIDGKTLRGSMDRFTDKKALHQLSAFELDGNIILAHIDVDEKSNEIPAAQQLLKELNLTGCVFTLDAMHCQKKR
jgi:hypothetical protein